MIVEYTRYKIVENRRALFEEVYRKAGEFLASSSHRLRSELSHSAENPDYYTLRIEWDSEGGHFKGFRSTPEFKTFLALVQPFVTDIEEICHYEVIAEHRKTSGSPVGLDLLSIVVGD